MKRSRN